MKKIPVLLIIALVMLLTAIGMVFLGQTLIPEPRFTGKLHELLPAAPPGWTMTEKAIADTPEMQKAVGELLNFDDGIFVEYTNITGDRLSVYVAYWTPGKMSHRLIAGHTPDVCWVGGGWKKEREDTLTDLQAGKIRLPSCQTRVFTTNGTPEYVWFWHLIGNESKAYGTGYTAPWHAAITDIFSKGLNQRDEQFFIRLSSNKPLESLRVNSPLNAILTALPWPESNTPDS